MWRPKPRPNPAATTESSHPTTTDRLFNVPIDYPSSLEDGKRLPSLALSHALSHIQSSLHTQKTRITTPSDHDIENSQDQSGSSINPSSKIKISREKNATTPSTVSPVLIRASTPWSGKASRRLSALFRLGEAALSQKLLNHQEQLRLIERVR